MKLNSIFKPLKKYFIGYADGYFQLPIVANSPELMFQNLLKTPFTKKITDDTLSINTPFFKGVQTFTQLEEGLWFTRIDAHFKVDFCSYPYYEESHPADYFSLYYYICKNKVNLKQVSLKDVMLQTQSWTLHAPKSDFRGYIKGGTEGIFYCFYFDRNWAEKYIPISSFDSNHELVTFFKESQSSFICNDFQAKGNNISENIEEIFKNYQQSHFELIRLKTHVYGLVLAFIDHLKTKKLNGYDPKFKSMMIVENMIYESLTQTFPGLEQIAEKANVSVSTLKNIFKVSYGTSVFQFYKQKQMDLAMNVIKKNPNTTVKELAYLLKYENTSKFSAAFKKHHSILPSDLLRNINF
jgi:AraC-like DNA-binding protein